MSRKKRPKLASSGDEGDFNCALSTFRKKDAKKVKAEIQDRIKVAASRQSLEGFLTSKAPRLFQVKEEPSSKPLTKSEMKKIKMEEEEQVGP